MRRAILPFLCVIAITGCSASEASPFDEAVEFCMLDGRLGWSIGDEGASMTLDGASEGTADGLDSERLTCVLAVVETPDAVLQRMSRTSSLDGFQEADWDGMRATWSFHPDDGLDVILERLP